MTSISLSRLLARIGLILLILFGVIVVFDVSPPKILQPDWILNSAVVLSNTASIPLVGIVLVHLANQFAPQENGKLALRVGRLSALLALLFVLIQPMLAFAVWRNFRDLRDYNEDQIRIIQRKGEELKQAIKNSATFEQLQANMARLQGPPIPDQARSIGLGELRRQLLTSVSAAQASFPSRLTTPTSEAYKEIYKKIGRASILSLIGSIGFALLAWNPMAEKNIVLLYLQSVGIFGITPLSLYNSSIKFLEQYKMKRREESKKKENRQSAVVHQRQMRRIEMQQIRQQKRQQISAQKQAEKARRQRDKLLELERKMERKRELEEEQDRDKR
ncbi:MAG: hypothetical protein ACK587_02990 [Cyanobacteriota bacterium]